MKTILSWSGGKDSALALHYLLEQDIEVSYLLCNINEHTERVTMHGIPVKLIKAQAASIGIPLVIIKLPANPTNDSYENAVAQKLEYLKAHGVEAVSFGDINLEDLRKYREENTRKVGLKTLFPLWGMDTKALMEEFERLKFKAVTVCVDASKLEKEHLGKELNLAFTESLPANVDPCGENGEFHSFVYDGPIFEYPVVWKAGGIEEHTYDNPESRFYFQDIISEDK